MDTPREPKRSAALLDIDSAFALSFVIPALSMFSRDIFFLFGGTRSQKKFPRIFPIFSAPDSDKMQAKRLKTFKKV